jgi:type III restriction enzyme
LVGGGSYSPDFAYLIKQVDGGQTLSLVVEAKSKDEGDLSANEAKKIAHAESFFNSGGTGNLVKFETQLKGGTISEMIKKALAS